MQYLLTLLILAAGPNTSIDLEGEEAVDVYRCDFVQQIVRDESQEADINYDGWPDHWTRLRDREHPSYVKIAIVGDESQPTQPERWLRVELDGGAAAVFAPAMDVSPKFTYMVEGRIRTDGLKHDEAYFSVSFYDGERNLVEQHHSPRVREAESWRKVRIGPLTPRNQSIREAVVELHVAPTDEADLSGAALFDDVRLARLPRMALTANSPHHVYTDPREIVLTCEVSGVREANPEIHLRLFDVHSRVVDEEHRELKGEPIEIAALASTAKSANLTYAGHVDWTPNITQPGFYRAEALMRTRKGVLHLRSVSLVLIQKTAEPQSRRAGRGGEFGWSVPGDETALSLEEMASLVSMAGVQWVKMPVWFDAHDQRRADRLAKFVERVEQEGITMVGVLDEPPPQARLLFGGENALPVASVFVEKDAWQAAIDPVMTRLSPIIRWWQLGADHDASFVGFPGLAPKIDQIRRRLTRFGQKVQVGFAWRWLEDRPPHSGDSPTWDFLAYSLDPEDPPLTAAELPRYLARLAPPAQQRWVSVQPLPRKHYDLTTRARDLVERMLAAKIAGAEAIFSPLPFDPESGLMFPDGSPTDLFLVWRTTAQMLTGAEYLGSLDLPQGSRNHVFARGGDSILVAWNDHPVQETLYLGENVGQVDLWDRAAPVASRGGRQTIEVGPLPTFITGVHTDIARWRMSFQFEDPRLASVFGRPQPLEYRYTNPFPQGVSGRVVFHTPDVWNVERDNALVKMAAHEQRKDMLRIALRPTASSGKQTVRIDFEITADRDYRFSVWRTIDVGLSDVAMEISTRLDEEGRLVVEQQFINRSNEPVSFLCQLFAPGRPRVRRPVLHLNHGRTTITYHLPDGEALLGQMLILRAEEIQGDRALNYRFEAK